MRTSEAPSGRSWPARASLAAGAVLAVTLVPITSSSATTASAPTCAAPTASAPVFITASCVDPELTTPFTDITEQESTTDPATGVTVSYTYVHGGFTGTNTKFAFYFPATSQYKGRFFEGTYPTISAEGTPDGQGDDPLGGDDPASIAFAISNGAYVVSTNNNGGAGAGGDLSGYRANAASAKYSRLVAAQLYGNIPSPRGYIYGASGGAYQTLGASENSSGVWQGAVPMVPGTPNSIPSNFTIVSLALRVLTDKLPAIADAEEPGGSGNPYATLNPEQKSVLHEVTRLGFPLGGWFQYASLNPASFTPFNGLIGAIDPSYVNDFWTLPGYAGSDPTVAAHRIQHDATVTSLVGSPTTQLVLSSVPTGELTGAVINITSGAAAGKSVPLGTVTGDTVGFGPGADPAVTGEIQPGDQVEIDNSAEIAYSYYHRYQLPTPDLYAWNQFRDSAGNPLYPQRPFLLGPLLANGAGGSIESGDFHGKMIMLASSLDIQAFPWSADWYHQKAISVRGKQHVYGNYRIWYSQNSPHGPSAIVPTHEVPYLGEMQQALLYLDAWVGNGVHPPASTNYRIDSNTQLQLPPTAARRRGVQPVVNLTAQAGQNRSDVTQVAVGQQVTFSAKAQLPPGTGQIVSASWDYKGAGTYPVTAHLGAPASRKDLTGRFRFTQPGTYFPAIRFTSERSGSPTAPYGLVENLARVRVVVHP